jgi:uncharacterized protein
MAPRAPRPPRAHRSRRWWIIAAVVVVVVLLASLKSLATLYTDDLWFSSVNLHSVWSTLLGVKLGLFASFLGVFFVLLFVNLIVADRIGSGAGAPEPDDELVRRYQRFVHPYARRIYAAIAIVVGLIAAAGSIGEWQNWLLFTHSVSFGVKDPQFHKDVSFYVFHLPFLEFLVNWFVVALIVVLIITAIFHYLNGGIRTQRSAPRVRPVVKAHLSVLVALIAIAKAAGYVLARYQLVTSTNGYVEGAGYTDVHARLPALELLFWISLAAAAVLLWNIRRQGWTLPVLAIGLWAFVALAIGVIYPAISQALTVNPNQISRESPYIARNIAATRAAYGLDNVKVSNFAGNTTLTAAQVNANQTTLTNIRLWDPSPGISLTTFQKLEDLHAYYTFQGLGVDRYKVDGKLVPVLVGVRQINSADLPSSTWVNVHLQYTHGEGMVIAKSNQAQSNGNPVFAVRDVPPESSDGLPNIIQPDVYFGLNNPGYVVANTKQAEFDAQLGDGQTIQSHYKGSGGVQLSSFLVQAAFAIREGDLNLLISSQITNQSRIMFVRDIQQMAQKAAPFLSFDADPYAVLVNGHIDWVLDGYTTTSEYPYSQNANTAQVPGGSNLPGSYNYVRNSVKLVIDAYSGKMTFYAVGNDPILRAYEAAFPHMFTPISQMNSTLKNHLRYPEDMFSIQAAMFGRYHVLSPSTFYTQSTAWSLSPTSGAGSPGNALSVTLTTNSQGETVSGSLSRMAPQYQVLQLPGQQGQTFTISDAYVPKAGGSSIQNLSAFLMGTYDPGHLGELRAYVTPPGQTTIGPALADSEIQANSQVSQEISLLDQHGSSVLLGNILMVPVDQAILYVRPLYVESSGNPQPQLRDVIAVFGQKVQMDTTLSAALSDVLGTPVGASSIIPTSPTTPTAPGSLGSGTAGQVQNLLTQASTDYENAQAALKAGGSGALGTYQSDIDAMNGLLQQAQQLLSSSGVAPTTKTATKGSTKKSATTTTTASSSEA